MDRPYTVSEVTQAVKGTLESGFPRMWVVGEISNYTHHSSGHRYFSLKDESAQIRCVMWRWTKLDGFTPESGLQVVAQGDLTVYERGGQYQLRVQRMLPAGAGQQQAALEELKKRLAAEGLFDPERKRPLPAFPAVVGVVTSQTGAAIRDIVKVVRRRFPATRVVVRHAAVQGAGAAEDIAQGIRDFNAWGKADVLIVGRGGGSAEDLAAFNEEVVVRAVVGSAIPVVSAVGHEVDVSLADLAADHRAPTPSAAGEMVVPDAASLAEVARGLSRRLQSAVAEFLEDREETVAHFESRYSLRRVEDLVLQQMQRVDDMEDALGDAIDRLYTRRAEAYRRLTGQLGALSPLRVLSRGYSLAQQADTGVVVTDAGTLTAGDRLRIRFARGESTCSVESTTPSTGGGT